MQKFIVSLFIVFYYYNSNAQSWTYKAGENAFDGKYKTCSIVGNGTEFPYSNPLFVINVFKGKITEPNIYLAKVPSGSCDNNKVLIKFDRDEKIYKPTVSISTNKEQWFLDFTLFEDVTNIVNTKVGHFIVKDNQIVYLKKTTDTSEPIAKELNAKDSIDLLNPVKDNLSGADFYRCKYKGKIFYVNITYLERMEPSSVKSNEVIEVPVTKTVPTNKEFRAFINDLKTHSKMNVRLLSDCIQYDCIFSLSGASTAISFVMNTK